MTAKDVEASRKIRKEIEERAIENDGIRVRAEVKADISASFSSRNILFELFRWMRGLR